MFPPPPRSTLFPYTTLFRSQMTVKLYFEPSVEPYFHEDSYGYRPRKGAIQALEITRKRCWRYNWVFAFDIKWLFDIIFYLLLMYAVENHTQVYWIREEDLKSEMKSSNQYFIIHM